MKYKTLKIIYMKYKIAYAILITFLIIGFIWAFSALKVPPKIKDDLSTRLFLEAKNGEVELQSYVISGNYIIAYVPTDVDVDIIASKIIFNESSGIHDTWGDLDYEFPAFGIGQFQERTFLWLAEKSNMVGLEWKNEQDQIKLLKWAIKNGHCDLWSTCPVNYDKM